MSAKHRLATVTVVTAAAGAVIWPTADALAAGTAQRDTRPGRPAATVQQVSLPDGSHARLTSGDGRTSVTVTRHGAKGHTIDGSRPAADLDRLHLRIIGADTARPTLRATVDGTKSPTYYDFASGAARHTPDGATGAASHPPKEHRPTVKAAHRAAGQDRTTAQDRTTGQDRSTGQNRTSAQNRTPGQERTPGQDRAASGGTAERPHKVRLTSSNPVKRVVQAGEAIKGRHDVRTPALAGAVLLAAGGGAYGIRFALRRPGREDT
ncbi:hypothetical protein [Streptomyces sp. ISL-11]|uniref:hypothetical protein n=1 Tax=Streptomyces sp. ISL-11 TaxID=2819174 RepID=UPI001BE5F677|nr:hypothetical protein [Streptomyces sp. ISL-11]MBT2385064.1 hypothetical protein [Streptomyces sp. ISL-11]